MTEPLTPEQEKEARGAWSRCYINDPENLRCGSCAGDYLAAALATIDALREQVRHAYFVGAERFDIHATRAEIEAALAEDFPALARTEAP